MKGTVMATFERSGRTKSGLKRIFLMKEKMSVFEAGCRMA